jgi:hypothetical protein
MQEGYKKCISFRIAKNNLQIRHSAFNKDYTRFNP